MALLNSIIWNGKSIRDFGAEITEIRGRGKPEISRKSLSIAGRHGELTFGTKYLPRRIELDGYMEGASHTTLLGDIDNLKDLFSMRDSIEALGNEQLSDTDLVGKLEFGDQTDRHFRAQYDGMFGLRDISSRWMKNDFIRFGVRFLCTDPFAYDNILTEVTMAGAANEFKVFDTETHYSECDIDIHGAVTNPVIVTGDKVGVAHFDNDDDLRNVENVNVAGNFAAAFGYRSRKTLTSQQSKAIQIVNKDNLFYDRGATVNNLNFVNFNSFQGSLRFWVKPYFDGDDGISHFIFQERFGVNSEITLEKTSSDVLTFTFRNGGVSRTGTITVTSANFTAGTWHFIFCRWDSRALFSGSTRVKLDLDADSSSNNNGISLSTQVGSDFSFGQDFNNNGSNLFDGLIHWQIYERPLTDTEVSDLRNSGAGVEPFVTPDTKLLSAGELSSGDPVSVQYPWVDNKLGDGDMEIDPNGEWSFGGVGGSGANTDVTNESTIVKYDTQSAQLDWASAASGEYAFLNSDVLVDNQDYFYRLWVNIATLSGADSLFLDIDGNSIVHTRQLNVTDDLGASFVIGDWLYFEGTFEADGAVSHEFRIRKNGANGNATVYVDQMDVQVNKVDNAPFEGTYSAGLAPSWINSDSTVTEENTLIHTGSAAQKFVTSAGNKGIRQNELSLSANKWYLVYVWARGGSGGEAFRLQMLNFTGILGTSKLVSTLTTSYQKYTLLFRTASDATGDLFLGADSAAATIYVDDAGIIELDTVTANAASKATPESISYSPEKYGQGLRIDGADTLSWAVVGNKNEGTIIVWFEPQFAADWDADSGTNYIFNLAFSSGENLQLFYNFTTDQWNFVKTVGFSAKGAVSAAQTFLKGNRICIVGTYGSNGVNIYTDSVIGTPNANTAALSNNPTTLKMSNQAATLFPDSIVDELYVYSRELSQQEATARFNAPRATKLDNRVFGITRTYAVNDKAIIRTEPETLEFADENADTIVNDIASMNSGSQFPRLTANKAVVYNKVAADSININYRKRWL